MNQDVRTDDEAEISLIDLLYTAVGHWRLLTIGPLLVGVLVLGISFLITPTFTARTSFLPPQQMNSATALLQSMSALGGLAGAAVGLKNPSDQYLAFLQSRSLKDALIHRFQLKGRYEAETLDDTRTALTAHVNVNAGKDGLIFIEVDDYDPVFAAQLANAHVEELGKLLDRLAVTEAQQRRQFFDKQLRQTQANLAKAELVLKSTGVDASTLKTNPISAVESVARIQAEITAQEVKLASMRGYLTESAQAFKQAQSELAALKAQSAKIANSTQQVEAGTTDYIARYRDVKYHETLFELFARQFELAKVDESREGATIQVLDTAQPPERKSKPRKALLAVAATVLSGAVLLLFVLCRQTLRHHASNPRMADRLARLRTAWR